MALRINTWLPDLAAVLGRFPVAVLAAIAVWIYYLTGGRFDLFGSNATPLFTAMGVFFAGGAGHLLAEGRGFSRLANVTLAAALGGAAGLVLYFFDATGVSELFLLSGLVLLLMVAAYLRGNATQGALWLFNMRLGLAVLLALVVGVVFGAGLSAVIAGLKFLLNFDFGYQAYDHVWATAILLVGPLYGLSLVPGRLDEEINISAHKGTLLERGLSVLVNYVLVPLALVYVLILHAYAVKIIAGWELPKGEIGTMVSLFAIGGTATWLLAWPWREQGTWLLRFFMRAWFWFIPVPAALLAIAIWRRVSDYGVTPDRYGIALVAVWTVLVFVTLLARRNRTDMRVIIGGAAVLLLVASCGPQGAYSVTARSQFARLTALLQKGGALKDGKFSGKVAGLDQKRINDGYSLIEVLDNVRGLGPVVALFPAGDIKAQAAGRGWNWDLRNELNTRLGLSYDYAANEEGRFSFSPSSIVSFVTPPAVRVLGPLSVYTGGTGVGYSLNGGGAAVKSTDTPVPDVRIKLEAQQFSVFRKATPVSLAMADLVRKIQDATVKPGEPQPTLRVDMGEGVSIVIVSASGKLKPVAEVENMTLWLVLPE